MPKYMWQNEQLYNAHNLNAYSPKLIIQRAYRSNDFEWQRDFCIHMSTYSTYAHAQQTNVMCPTNVNFHLTKVLIYGHQNTSKLN